VTPISPIPPPVGSHPVLKTLTHCFPTPISLTQIRFSSSINPSTIGALDLPPPTSHRLYFLPPRRIVVPPPVFRRCERGEFRFSLFPSSFSFSVLLSDRGHFPPLQRIVVYCFLKLAEVVFASPPSLGPHLLSIFLILTEFLAT